MVRYVGTVSIGLVGCKKSFEFEADDDATDDEIEAIAHEAMSENIEWNYERKD